MIHKEGSKTIRPRRIVLWSFRLSFCGWDLGLGSWILGLGQVLGTRPNSHGFDKEISSGI